MQPLDQHGLSAIRVRLQMPVICATTESARGLQFEVGGNGACDEREGQVIAGPGLEWRSRSRPPTFATFCAPRDQRPWIDIALVLFSGPGLLDRHLRVTPFGPNRLGQEVSAHLQEGRRERLVRGKPSAHWIAAAFVITVGIRQAPTAELTCR